MVSAPQWRIGCPGAPSMARLRPYEFYDIALSLCSTCYRKVEGKIVFQDGKVLLLKQCPEHGWERVLIADDVEYYRRCREVFIKPPEMPIRFNTPVLWGCPYDCGLCADHQQHSCVAIVEITRLPVSAAVSAIDMLVRSRISPTKITWGSWRSAPRRPRA